MKLIFIYGPPAVGKLTVTKELIKITGFRNFHNHYAYDFVNTLVNHTNPNFPKYVEKMMLEGIEMQQERKFLEWFLLFVTNINRMTYLLKK